MRQHQAVLGLAWFQMDMARRHFGWCGQQASVVSLNDAQDSTHACCCFIAARISACAWEPASRAESKSPLTTHSRKWTIATWVMPSTQHRTCFRLHGATHLQTPLILNFRVSHDVVEAESVVQAAWPSSVAFIKPKVCTLRATLAAAWSTAPHTGFGLVFQATADCLDRDRKALGCPWTLANI